MNALTFDIEEYFQVTGFADRIAPGSWEQYESRVELGTRAILQCCAEADVRATFFILGWVADRHPRLVRQIAAEGHEIASHGYWHQRVDGQSPREFRRDVTRAKNALEAITGRAVTAYRAPSFSITPACAWAYEVLIEAGYRADSSQSAGRGNASSAPRSDGRPYLLQTPSGSLWECPIPTLRLLGRDLPVGGGGYFRLFPYCFTRWALRRIEGRGVPLNVYLHPWEFDPDQPALAGSWQRRFRHRVNLHRTEERLRQLLADFPFGPLHQLLPSQFNSAA